MAQFGTLHDRKFADQAHDLRGAELYGSNDENVGRINDAILDHRDGLIK